MSADGGHIPDVYDAIAERMTPDAEHGPAWMECEQAVLGGLMSHPGWLHTHGAGIEEQDFSDDLHQTMFRAISACEAKGYQATPLSVLRFLPLRLQDDKTLRRYLANLFGEFTTLICLPAYVEQLKYYRFRREVVSTNRDAANAAEHAGPDSEPAKMLEEQVARLMALAPQMHREPNIRDLIFGRGEVNVGLRTGFAALDDLIAPMLPGHLIVVAARLKVGKSPLLLNIAHALASAGIASGVVSLELRPDEVERRLLCALSDVDLQTIQARSWNAAEGQRIEDAWARRETTPLHIIGSVQGESKWTTSKLRAKCTELVRLKGCRALCIDQLSWLKVEGKVRDKFDQLGQAVGDVKAIAQELGVPIVLAVQLNREADAREYTGPGSVRRPSVKHIYGADEIAQAADVVLMIHRAEVVLQDLEPPRVATYRARSDDGKIRDENLHSAWSMELESARGKAQLIAAARRSGPGGYRDVAFIPDRMWFVPLHGGRLVHGNEESLPL